MPRLDTSFKQWKKRPQPEVHKIQCCTDYRSNTFSTRTDHALNELSPEVAQAPSLGAFISGMSNQKQTYFSPSLFFGGEGAVRSPNDSHDQFLDRWSSVEADLCRIANNCIYLCVHNSDLDRWHTKNPTSTFR